MIRKGYSKDSPLFIATSSTILHGFYNLMKNYRSILETSTITEKKNSRSAKCSMIYSVTRQLAKSSDERRFLFWSRSVADRFRLKTSRNKTLVQRESDQFAGATGIRWIHGPKEGGIEERISGSEDGQRSESISRIGHGSASVRRAWPSIRPRRGRKRERDARQRMFANWDARGIDQKPKRKPRCLSTPVADSHTTCALSLSLPLSLSLSSSSLSTSTANCPWVLDSQRFHAILLARSIDEASSPHQWIRPTNSRLTNRSLPGRFSLDWSK